MKSLKKHNGTRSKGGLKKSVPPEKAFDGVIVRGAREHNLKNVNVNIIRNKLTVITGLSGSGKSSLAFDTIYAEGQRRYVESLSSHARQFIQQLKKPEVDRIQGLSPAIAIDQRSINTNPRSTVGTVTEIYDYLRLLMARVGTPNCPTHKIPVSRFTPKQIIEDIMKLPKGTKYHLVAPVVQGRKGEYLAEFRKWVSKGYTKVFVDGKWLDLSQAKKLARHKRHDIDLLMDRLIVMDKYKTRLSEGVHRALGESKGLVSLMIVGGERRVYSIHRSCSLCAFSFPEIEPRLFSFNNPRGACETCGGMGSMELAMGEGENKNASHLGPVQWKWVGRAKSGQSKKSSESTREEGEMEELDEYAIGPCPDCEGDRLRKSALNVFIDEKHIGHLARMSVVELLDFLGGVKFSDKRSLVAEPIIEQICHRLKYMERVGTGYLSLHRATRTLSGGEVQRIRLATQVGSALIGVLYVLDEPSIGLHPRDHSRLLEIIKEIRDRGNTVILVEHDEDTIRAADHVIDMGPRAGRLGGEIIAEGPPKTIEKLKESLTGRYLSGREVISIPKQRRPGCGEWITIKGASGNNLKKVQLNIPLGTLCGVTGVSGSGKSTLIRDTLYRILSKKLYKSVMIPAAFETISGVDSIDKVIEINQRPIGRTPRSVPATYVGLMTLVRDLFAQLPDSKLRGYKPGYFSFNIKGGRCEACQGVGQKKVEMHFLANVYVRCDECHGQRYSRETQNIKFKDKSIADIMNMTISEALGYFKNHKNIYAKLETLMKVGLDYLTLGQSSSTLSGGEAQRIKLSKELSKRSTGRTLYILDEPTTGLHFADIGKLLELLHSLVDKGNTVLVVEHNLDVIKNCDYVVDLGPEGGKAGGEILFEGTPEKLILNKKSYTGQYLKGHLARNV